MSPHPRYNSRVFAFLSRQFGAWRDRTQELTRYAKMLGRWTAEAVAYPFYKAVKDRKILGQKVSDTVKQAVRLLSAENDKRQQHQPGKTSSSAIVRILDSISLSNIDSQLEVSPVVAVTVRPNKTATTLAGKLTRIAKNVKAILSFKKTPALKPTQECLAHQASIQKVNALEIQGVASVLETRKLVLVTPEQTVLDVLSLEQQKVLHQRITWEVASYYFYWRRKQQFQKRLAPLRKLLATIKLPQKKVFVLPSGNPELKDIPNALSLLSQKAVGLLRQVPRQLMPASVESSPTFEPHQKLIPTNLITISKAIAGWLSSKKTSQHLSDNPLAISSSRPIGTLDAIKQKLAPMTGLITKAVIGAIASMPLVVIPAIAAETSAIPIPKNPTVSASSEYWIDPNHLKTQLSLDELKGMIAHQEQSRTWLTYEPKPQSSSSQSQALNTPRTTAAFYSGIYEGEFGPEIRINAEFIGYETHLLEDILAWLDKIMVQVEAFFGKVWQWIGFALVLFLSGVQNIRQWIWE